MATDPSGGAAALGGFGGLLGGAAALGGLGYVLSKGPDPLPSPYQTLTNQYAPYQYSFGQQMQAMGQGGYNAGAAALAQAEAGTLTPEQKSVLSTEQTSEQNQALQMYAGMGRTPTKDTSYLGTSEVIDANIMKMAQGFIMNNIQTAFGQMSAALAETGIGLQFEQAAAADLMAAGQAQVQLDKQYSDEVASAFGALGKIFGGGLFGGGK